MVTQKTKAGMPRLGPVQWLAEARPRLLLTDELGEAWACIVDVVDGVKGAGSV